MLDRIDFMLSEAWTAFRRNGWMTFAAISTCAVALFLIGGLGYVYLRTQEYATGLAGQFEMRVFLKDDLTKEQISDVAAKVRGLDGVKSAVWIPKENAWSTFQKEYPELSEGIENPYPDSLKVVLTDIAKGDSVAASIATMPEVAEKDAVQYLKEEQQFLAQSLAILRWIGVGLGGLLFLTGGVLIYNAIRLTIVARRRELKIMSLVGASYGTIRLPLLIEGFVQGALGGILAGVLLELCQQMIRAKVAELSVLGEFQPVPLQFGVILLGGIGAVYGLLCSASAVREPLKNL
ncbi:MAG: cell division protein FtsX [Fimbriimonadaceae bacterium]